MMSLKERQLLLKYRVLASRLPEMIRDGSQLMEKGNVLGVTMLGGAFARAQRLCDMIDELLNYEALKEK